MPSATMYYELIRLGHYDDSMVRRVGGVRETLTGVQRLELAMAPLVRAGELTAEQQQELIRELEKHLAKKAEQNRLHSPQDAADQSPALPVSDKSEADKT